MWSRLEGPKGSNEGGLYKSPENRRFYVKFMDDEHLFNELLAIRLQEAAGTLVPHARVQVVNGRKAQTSPMVPVRVGRPGEKFVSANDQIKDIGMHIWLANWDALTAGNIGYIGKNVIIVDAGGSMRFRAMGSLRDFQDDAPEFEQFQESSRYSWLFRATTKDQLDESIQKVLELTDSNIDAIVDEAQTEVQPNVDLRNFYKTVLKARKRALQEKIL